MSIGVLPPSAEALRRKKLLKRAMSLEQKISDVTAALAATQGGSVLADKGAKLHSALRTANDELAATHTTLNDLKTSESSAEAAYVATGDSPGVSAPSLHGGPSQSACVSAQQGVAGKKNAEADALADLLATKATVKDDNSESGAFDKFRYTP